jgi:hypothetical protein
MAAPGFPKVHETPPEPGSPSAINFMLSQNGLAKAKALHLQS